MKSEEYKFAVFGRVVLVRRSGEVWLALYVGAEGKCRPAEDIRIPPNLHAERLAEYLADLCHEWANPEYSIVELLEG